MDILSDVLDTLKFKGTFYFSTDFTAPWGIEVPHYKNVCRFHMALSGALWVKIENVDKHIRLSTGDMIMIPNGSSHIISDKQNSPVEYLDNVLQKSGYTGDGHLIYGGPDAENKSNLICGHFDFDEKFTHPLISNLPDYILITGKDALDISWFDNAMKFMSYETQTNHLGNEAIIKRLSEILFIHSVRVWNMQANNEHGFIIAITHKNIGKGLKAFHANPQYPWTLEKLAIHAGSSRSVFANQFKALMNVTPLKYIAFWRMQKACEKLIETSLSIDTIAEQSGYLSLASFSKVFKKYNGMGPGNYRKQNSKL